jgi:hypothetical protein
MKNILSSCKASLYFIIMFAFLLHLFFYKTTTLAINYSKKPKSIHSNNINDALSRIAFSSQALPLLLSKASFADDSKFETYPLGKNAYTNVGTAQCCRLLNGMWQVSGMHGFSPEREKVVAEMARCIGKHPKILHVP